MLSTANVSVFHLKPSPNAVLLLGKTQRKVINSDEKKRLSWEDGVCGASNPLAACQNPDNRHQCL